MNAESTVAERSETGESAEVSGLDGAPPRFGHSLLDVLMPATPPEPKNARVIRLFDCETVGGERPVAPRVARREPSPREAAKAARKLSLFAAAGLE